MALDATVAGASANSYLTIDAADAHNDDRNGPQAERWAAASTETKENALIEGAILIDSVVRASVPYSLAQALAFPRASDVDANDDPVLPPRLLLAAYEQAAYLVANAKLLDAAASRRARQMFSFDEDGISGQISLDPTLGLIAPKTQLLLNSLVATTGQTRIGSVQLRSKIWQPTRTSTT